MDLKRLLSHPNKKTETPQRINKGIGEIGQIDRGISGRGASRKKKDKERR